MLLYSDTVDGGVYLQLQGNHKKKKNKNKSWRFTANDALCGQVHLRLNFTLSLTCVVLTIKSRYFSTIF